MLSLTDADIGLPPPEGNCHLPISGAVGTFAHIDPAVEAHVAEKMGLIAEPISTQIIPRDRHAMFFAVLGVIASSVERLAKKLDICNALKCARLKSFSALARKVHQRCRIKEPGSN